MDRVELLIGKADGDLIAAKNVLAHPDSYPETIAFHLQQAMEKLLKALLVHSGLDVPRTHDLNYLIDILIERYPKIEKFYDLSEKLVPHAK